MDLRKKINRLPDTPGVYFFKDKTGRILYVGKATSLRSRVRSYYAGTDERGTVLAMLPQITDIEIRRTDSVLEALILEANLIKSIQPPYNIEGKDDKSFSYFVITKDAFPRVLILREKELAKNKSLIKHQFGPYTSKKQMEIALDIVRRIFPFHSRKQASEDGCFDFQIGRCPGPYAGKISLKDYRHNIRGVKMILDGRKKLLLQKIKKEMQLLSRQRAYEQAAKLRDKIFALQHIRDIALINRENSRSDSGAEVRIEAYDISNISGQYATGSMVVFSGEHPQEEEYRKFKIKAVETINDVAMMREVLIRRFRHDWTIPDLILLDGGTGHLNMGRDFIKRNRLNLPLVAVAKGVKRDKLELHGDMDSADEKIKSFLQNKSAVKHIMDEAHRFAVKYHRKVRSVSYRQ